MDISKIRIRAERLDIDFDQALHTSHEPQQLKQYNMATLPY